MIKRVSAVALLTAVFSASASAQAQTGELEIEAIDSEGHPQVTVELSVPFELQEALREGQLVLRENGQARPVDLSILSQSHLRVLLVVDTSGSMSGAPLTAAQDAAKTFVGLLPPDAEVGVLGFGTDPVLAGPFTTDRSASRSAIDSLRASGETALYDAILAALEHAGSEPEAKTALVVLSDGGDTVSSAVLEEAVAALGESEGDFFAVELQSPENNAEPLHRLAGAADGLVIQAQDPEALSDAYLGLASRLTNRYLLRYRSEAFGSSTVNISLAWQGEAVEVDAEVVFPAPPSIPSSEPATAPTPIVLEGWLYQPALLSDPRLLRFGTGLVFVSLLALAGLLVLPHRYEVRLSDRFGRRRPIRESALSGLTQRAAHLAEQSLERRGRKGALASALEQAGILLRPGEFAVLIVSGVVIGYSIGFLVSGFWVGVLLAVLAALAPRFLISHMASKRRAAFADQLTDTLILLAGSLRAGYGLLQAADAVAQEASSPTSDEFRRLVLETRLGRDLRDALHALHQRVGTKDFEWVVQAIDIHQEVGGDLAEVLETVAETIRDRNQLRRQVKALSAEGRMSAIILLGLPFALVGVMLVFNPDYLSELTNTGVGRVMMAVGLVQMVIGTIWMRKVVRIQM